MRILYLSRLTSDISVGPCWSIPASVKAQSKLDDVIWINTTNSELTHWHETGVFHKLSEFPSKLDENLLNALSGVDLVVFESFYNLEHVKFAKILRRYKIPYVIIPRGALTKKSLNVHGILNKLKKIIARQVIFLPYTRSAAAIQYLTNSEKKDSGDKWCQNYFILPNGYSKQVFTKRSFCKNGIKAVFIGRPTIYHKGLDLLIDACKSISRELMLANFHLDIYAPKKNDYALLEQLVAHKSVNNIISLHGEVRDKEKIDKLLDSDLFIMTSRFEGHPMGLVEALSLGLPVFVTPGTNMRDEVSYFNAGWTSDANVGSIAKILLRIISEKQEFEIKSRNALKLSELYDWDSIALRTHEFFETLRGMQK